jgi:hypothetical protein
VRRIVLTINQAQDLETEITGWIVDNGYEPKYAKPVLKDLGVPPEVMVGIFERVDRVIEEQACLESCPPSRDNALTYVEAFKTLDKYLGKCFRVVGKRGGKTSYTFDVG